MGSKPASSIVVFAKWPRPGHVKTRLTPALTPVQACHVHELMLNAVNLTFLAFARYHTTPLSPEIVDPIQAHMTGQMAVIFVMAVAAAEVAIGLGIIMAIFRLRQEIDIDEMNLLKG